MFGKVVDGNRHKMPAYIPNTPPPHYYYSTPFGDMYGKLYIGMLHNNDLQINAD